MTATLRARWLRWWPLAGLIAVLALFFNRLAFTNLILARGDTFLYFYPYWQAAAEALRGGRLPLWNPALFMGAPFLANSQVGFFYPLNWPLWWLLPTPYALSASILLHVLLAAGGTYLAGRRCLHLDRPAAVLAVILFALGGYLTAQVEHINQLQGLAWLPWHFAVLGAWWPAASTWRTGLRKVPVLAVVFALQLLAGHSQTTFITLIGLLAYLTVSTVTSCGSGTKSGVSRFTFHVSRSTLYSSFFILFPFLLALLLAAVQLAPTLELAQHSGRAGGLPFNEAVSFSLHPLLLGRALLPHYGQSLFTEYVAFLPLTALALAILAMGQVRQRPAVWPFLVLVILGLFLALGAFNPIYWLLARLPGFNLFRAPARWLALYAFGASLLAGVGWQAISGQSNGKTWQVSKTSQVWVFLVLIALLVWDILAPFLARWLPFPPEAPAEFPSWLTLTGWMAELALLFLACRSCRPTPTPALALSLILFLFLSSRSLPYNHPTTPEAFFDLRPAPARLMAESQEQSPPGRFLSMSHIFFDPGDLPEIESIYAEQLPPDAIYDYVVAVKQKEIIAPNLSLLTGRHSVDGFDGGILPLASYVELTTLLLPGGARAADGRLREYLPAVPDARWLDLFNARYLITDKVGDAWREGVFFDLQHPAVLTAGESVAVGYVPNYEATELWLVAAGEAGLVEITAETGQTWQLSPERATDDLWRILLPQPAVLQSITLSAQDGEWQVMGLSLVDGRDETFQPLVLGQYRLIHSGDVKIYENLDVLPRAFLAHNWSWQPDTAAAVTAMQAADFDPTTTAVLTGRGQDSIQALPNPATATVSAYGPERVAITTNSDVAALLVLTDANYPGWQAALDGRPTDLYTADALFRAVMVPAGRHEVTFTYTPRSLNIGLSLNLVGVVLTTALALFLSRRSMAVC